MANSEILAAIKSLQSSFESHLLVTNQLVKEFMYSVDSRFASLQHNKPPPGFPSPSSSSHPPPTELSPFTESNCDASGGGAAIPFPFEKSRPKSPMEAFALAKVYEARLEESRNESRSGVREPIKAIPFISIQPFPPPNPLLNPSLTSNHSSRHQLGPFTRGYADQSMEFHLGGFISATTTQGPSTLHPPPQKIDALFQPPAEPPPHCSVDHWIHLLPKTGLINVEPYICPQFQEETMAQLVAEMLTRGMIRPSRSPFSSPSGSYRSYVDYRVLTAVTVRDHVPIPTIDELLDDLQHAQVFPTLDLYSSYHQIRVQSRDIHKTVFRTSDDHYEFLVISFGLCNALSTFQSAMNQISALYLHRFVAIFLDDMLVYSPTMENHFSYLEQVFECFSVHKYYLKLGKCVFGLSSVDYLGHILATRVVSPDPTKIASMEAWPVRNTPKQLRAYLSLIGYCQWIKRNYASIAIPLTDLLRKDSFSWSPQAQLSFEALKKAMSTAPLLQLLDFSLEFIVETNASNVGIGTVLMQSNQPIAFHNKFWHNLFHRVFHVSTLKLFKGIAGENDCVLSPGSCDSNPGAAPIAICFPRDVFSKTGLCPQVLVQWWEDWNDLCATYPNLHLEDKVIVKEEGVLQLAFYSWACNYIQGNGRRKPNSKDPSYVKPKKNTNLLNELVQGICSILGVVPKFVIDRDSCVLSVG